MQKAIGGNSVKTLIVYYSKTGNTRRVAEALISEKNCDSDELLYDEKAKHIDFARDPSGYDCVILLTPVWALSLAEPMKLYVAKHKSTIKRYALIVTCGAVGLRGCARNCLSSIGIKPEIALKFRSKHVKQGDYDLSPVYSLFE